MFYPALLIFVSLSAAVVLYILGTFITLLFRQYVSPLRGLPGPPSRSFFIGNLKEMHDQENNNLVARWTASYGHTFVYRGFVGGHRLMTTDPLAVSHILGHAYDFPKPDFIRDALAEMAAGHDGLLTVEGNDHHRQRKIISPAFSASHIRTLSPLFHEKACQLRDIWLDIIRHHSLTSSSPPSPNLPSSPSDPLVQPVANPSIDSPHAQPTSPLGHGKPLIHLPNPFAGFEPSKTLHTSNSSTGFSTSVSDGAGLRPRTSKPSSIDVENVLSHTPTSPSQYVTIPSSSSDTDMSPSEGPKVDVLVWLARATLDTIGDAGFGYSFNSLATAARTLRRSRHTIPAPSIPSSTVPPTSAPADVVGEEGESGAGEEEENELARAFGIIFSTARQFRIFTILQVWFPILRRFKRDNATMQQARATMNRIGMQLITERREEVLNAASKSSRHTTSLVSEDGDEKTTDGDEDLDERTKGRDLLSVLIRSNASPSLPATQRLTLSETLSQISTFLSAGHETTSSALTWTLYVLAKDPNGHEIQRKLRRELREIHRLHSSAVPSGSSTEEELGAVLNNSYLDVVVRESLRVNSPVTTTMRVALKDSIIPISSPLRSPHPGSDEPLANGSANVIRLNKGDIISIPIQAINKNKSVYGDDADEFRPERWLENQTSTTSVPNRRGVQGLWGGILTFLNGNPINGNRACIGYRFSINEIKIFLYVILRDIDFTLDEGIEIEKKVNVVTRPCVKSEPHLGNQMPLRMRYMPPDDI